MTEVSECSQQRSNLKDDGYIRFIASVIIPLLNIRWGMNMKKLLVICLLGCVLAGCDSQPKMDASNEIALKASIEKVRDRLPDDKKVKFDESIQSAMFNSIDFNDLVKSGSNGDMEKSKQKFYKLLDGKTADQLITEVEKIESKRSKNE
ncbi:MULTISPECIES: DUF6694 family lipoprotein [Photorhabdus]|nr:MULTISPECIES: DUF6694 family lipoprotein [Photorhabdus]